MALIRCPECGREISQYADKCPGCGWPVPKPTAREGNYSESSNYEDIYEEYLRQRRQAQRDSAANGAACLLYTSEVALLFYIYPFLHISLFQTKAVAAAEPQPSVAHLDDAPSLRKSQRYGDGLRSSAFHRSEGFLHADGLLIEAGLARRIGSLRLPVFYRRHMKAHLEILVEILV